MEQGWVLPESVRTIDAVVPIVSFATRFSVTALGPNHAGPPKQLPLRLDVSFEGEVRPQGHARGASPRASPRVPRSVRTTPATWPPVCVRARARPQVHNGLATNAFVSRTLCEHPDARPLTLVLKQFLAERSLDKPYLGGLSSCAHAPPPMRVCTLCILMCMVRALHVCT